MFITARTLLHRFPGRMIFVVWAIVLFMMTVSNIFVRESGAQQDLTQEAKPVVAHEAALLRQLNEIQVDRDNLFVQAKRLAEENKALRKENDDLKSRLGTLETEKDHLAAQLLRSKTRSLGEIIKERMYNLFEKNRKR